MSERTRQFTGAAGNTGLRLLPAAPLISDLALLAATAAIATFGRGWLEFLPNPYQAPQVLSPAGYLVLFGWIAVSAIVGAYDRMLLGSGTEEYLRVARAGLITAAAVGIGCYLVKYQLSRGFFLLTFAVGIPLLCLGRFAVRRGLHAVRRRGHLQVRVLMAGSPAQIDEVSGVLTAKPWLGFSVIGAVVPTEYADRPETGTGVPIIGDSADAVLIAQASGTDTILFAGGTTSGQELRETIWALEEHGIHVAIVPSVTDISQERITVRPIGGLPVIHVGHPTWADASRLGKRVFDLVGSLALLLAFSPLLAFVAARIWIADRGPVLFSHQRIGRDGQPFACFKFRTMVPDAEAMVKDLQEQTGQSALLFKMKDDPRITKPGRWLRRYSIDEIPQLLNVVRGEMSLVGPRPQVQAEVDLYERGMERRLLVRPGMTGLWQVSGRNDLSAEEARRLDLFYVDNWSMMQDLSILARTFRAVVGSSGAY
ncbi:sugar transferase [Nocardioides sp. GY 10113]|uniref:sugar transferase n=1 Tax=Nocardioides sp. GY 10113 TaxID=2569761 RepID=UPI0010A8E352|nr:sugar transferase [Nocardioides sp. GY 10113]TIC88402.1 sugar transferase [Nocardioides sp. GY 10113]